MGGRGQFSRTANSRRYEGRRRSVSGKGDKILNAGWLGIEGNKTSEQLSVINFRERTKDADHEFGGYFDENGFPIIMREGAKGSVAFQYGDERGASSFIHNHPGTKDSDYGGTFSHGDLAGLLGDYKDTHGKMRTIYAVASEGTYRLSITNKHSDVKGFEEAFIEACKGPDGLDARFDKAYNKKGRKAACDVYHNWYKKNAKKFGFEYSRS